MRNFISVALIAISTFCVLFPDLANATNGGGGNTDLNASVSELAKSISELEREIQIKSEVSKIVTQIVAITSAITAVLGIGIYSGIKASISTKIIRPIETNLDKKVEIAKATTITWSFNEFAYTWWVAYEGILQKKLDGLQISEIEKSTALNAISNAIHAAHRGIGSVAPLGSSKEEILRTLQSETLMFRSYVHLINQFVYSNAAKFVITEACESDVFMSELDKQSDELLELSKHKSLGSEGNPFPWYEVWETVGFYKFHIGIMKNDDAMVSEGKKIIVDLIKRKRPSFHLPAPTKEFSDGVLLEFSKQGRLNLS
ncbi:hypothetical protein [Thalassobius sp. Cn5-15]|uniref:hypothetical protein n=1 Tax=Thalassobius sp. Cn5-15 TaxID=2917763 RepID=UPI001EF22783|nr:hypothetical protein [Thalassobius sp. Cn5-15]MCG7492491.1 hypothetical protein [Thalassobius sp. Cn5-15]